ncbi:MAG: hypothetical protein ACM3NF_00515 [Gemmatimonadota bacterium]
MVLRKAVALLLSLFLFPAAHAGEAYMLKFATLAPIGSTWMNIITDWANEVDKESQGRLKFKLYGGGVSGDEPDAAQAPIATTHFGSSICS